MFHLWFREKTPSGPGSQGREVVVDGRILKAGGLTVDLQRNERLGQTIAALLVLVRPRVDEVLEEVGENVLRTNAVT